MSKASPYKTPLKTISLLPAPVLRWMGTLSGIAWGLSDATRRNAVRCNMILAQDGKIPRLEETLAPFVHFHWTVFENLKYDAGNPGWVASHVRVQGVEHVRKARDKGGGVLHLTSHIGNWEIGAKATATLGFPLTLVVAGAAPSGVEEEYQTTREAAGLQIAWAGKHAGREALKALASGRHLGIVFDFVRNDRGIEIQWFGRPAKISRGPFWLAQKSGASVVPTFCVRRSIGQFDLIFEEPLEPSHPDFVQRAVSCMQTYQCRYRSQWARFHPIGAVGRN